MIRQLLTLTALAALLMMAMPTQAVDASAPIVSTPTTLYFHINGFQDFPINTQKPDDRYSTAVKVGLTTPTLSCIDNTNPMLAQTYHTLYGFSSPSYVEYDIQENGKPFIHPERGISYDALLDTSTQPFLYWYVKTTTGANTNPDISNVPVVAPMVSVQATMRTGSEVDVSKDALNTGDVIAEGRVTGMLAGPATDSLQPMVTTLGGSFPSGAEVTYLGQPDGTSPQVYLYKIPLTIQGDGTIPKATGYNVRVDMFLENPVCPTPAEKYAMPNVLEVYSSESARPRLELAVMNPIRVEYLHPQFVGDDLVVHTASNTVWGNYDVDETSPFSPTGDGKGIVLAITGPSAPSADKVPQVAFVQPTHDHFHHQDAVSISYLWKYKDDAPKDGIYTVTFTVHNDQRTATAVREAKFQIGSGPSDCENKPTDGTTEDCPITQPVEEPRDAPGAGMLVVVGLVAVAAFARRRA